MVPLSVVTIDDELLEKAKELSGIKKRSALVREGLSALIQRETARLGGTEPEISPIPRRRRLPRRRRFVFSSTSGIFTVKGSDTLTFTFGRLFAMAGFPLPLFKGKQDLRSLLPVTSLAGVS